MSNNTCYMCEAVATTVEHAPPRCLFPETKDLIDKSLDLRKQLITVPACNEHNTAKSTDDEYLLNILSLNITSGNHGIQQFLTKVNRAWDRSPGLKTTLLKTAKPAHVIDEINQESFTTFELTIDQERINASLDVCARALYFKKFGTKFLGEIQVIKFFLLDRDPQFNETLERLRKGTSEVFSTITPESDAKNPLIFTYKFHIEEDSNKVMMEMNFYEGSRAVAIFKAE